MGQIQLHDWKVKGSEHSFLNDNDLKHLSTWAFKYTAQKKSYSIMHSQNNSEEKEYNWRYHISSLQTILQSYNNQNRMVFGIKHT